MPIISVAIPTYKRPELLERCLAKLLIALDGDNSNFEVLVGDDSALPSNEALTGAFQNQWQGRCRYIPHATPYGQQGNFNDLIDSADGRFIQFVHDDDFLLPGAGRSILAVARQQMERPEPVLFATQLVNLDGSLRRKEGTRRKGYLSPEHAVRILLSKSSYIRFPAMLVPKESYLAVGSFQKSDVIPDWPVWLRLAAKYGISQQPSFTNAYTIHEAAGTSATFAIGFMLYLIDLLSSFQKSAQWTDREMDVALGRFLHRYILAGCIRSLEKRDFSAFKARYELFQHPMIAKLPCPPEWMPLKILAAGIARLS